MSDHTAPHPALDEANQRLIRTVDAIPDDELAGPSLLPGWSRAHVVAHLALNAEAFARVLSGVLNGERVAMYSSNESRDGDIDHLANESASVLRERLLASTTALDDAASGLSVEQRSQEVERTPGGISLPPGDVLDKRWREVEVHHADLGLDYGPQDWPPGFTLSLLEGLRGRGHWDVDFIGHATDLDGDWRFGAPGAGSPVVSGPTASLAWWLTGRGDGADLTSSTGQLPTIGAW